MSQLDRLLLALTLRAAGWGGLGLVVADCVLELWRRGEHWWALAAACFSPVTLLVWPWAHSARDIPLWVLLSTSAVSLGLAAALVQGPPRT